MLLSTAYALLRNGFADWEVASALAELRRTFEFSVRVIGLTSGAVVSMGGFKVATDLTLPELHSRLKSSEPSRRNANRTLRRTRGFTPMA